MYFSGSRKDGVRPIPFNNISGQVEIAYIFGADTRQDIVNCALIFILSHPIFSKEIHLSARDKIIPVNFYNDIW